MHSFPRPSPSGLRAACLAALAGVCAAPALHAADYYWNAPTSGTPNTSTLFWNSHIAYWKTAPSGGTSAPGFAANDRFHSNGRAVATQENVSSTFGNGAAVTLILDGGAADQVSVKATGAGVATAPALLSKGGIIAAAQQNSAFHTLSVGAFATEAAAAGTSGVTYLNSSTDANGRTLNLSIGTLSGEGGFAISPSSGNNRTVRLSIANAAAYTGNFDFSRGIVDFDSNVTSGGTLTLGGTARVVLDQTLSFAGVMIGGQLLAEGTYGFAALQTSWPAVFTSGSAAGSIVVRPPRTWYLTTDQAIGASWNTLAHWNSAANGSGAAPAALSPFDLYVNQVSGRTLRTPEAASAFGGGMLALANGAQLTVKAPSAGALTAIPVLINAGSPVIANGHGPIRQNLAIEDWVISGGATKLSAASGRGLGFSIGHLAGAGGLQTQSGGSFFLSLLDGSGYTGTLDHASGSLRFESVFSTRGAFAVGSSATVHLDKPAYFTSFTVGGASKPAGIHAYTTLNAAHPARFPSGAASGFVAVYAPDTAGPAQMFGVNLAGGEFGSLPGTYGTDYIYPAAAAFDYYHGKGLDLIRLPFKWERLQPVLNGALNSAELARLDTVVGHASARGMKIVLDMHNYARRKEGATTHLIGSGPVTLASFADVWRRIADHYKGNAAIHGYGIMNEPHDTGGAWPAMAQAAVNAIREVDLGRYVIVGGDSWSNAAGWRSKNPNLDIQDPVGRLLYEAHCYFDNDHSGTYDQSYDGEGAYPMIGVDRVKEFTGWLQERGARGFVGEYGVPGNDARWLVVLDNFLAYLSANGLSGTYWAGGPWWGTYPLSVEPTGNYTVDKPQMSVLQNYP